MGQQIVALSRNYEDDCDILVREVRMYKWRADPNFNSHIARVSFKNALTQYQQEQFAEFLQQQKNKQYLEIYKFKQQIHQPQTNSSQQVVIFEQYHCSLDQLRGTLSFEQTIYVLYALLTGFEEIRKVYDKVVVEGNCCFVTKEGAVRAWINPSPKSNQLWLGQFQQLHSESGFHPIIVKIIKMVHETGKTSKRCHIFYSQLLNILNQGTYRNCSFGQLRKWINQYCFVNHIQIPTLINIRHNNRECHASKEYQRQSRKTEGRTEKQNKQMFKSTLQSSCSGQSSQQILCRSKSFERTSFMTHQTPSVVRKSNLPNQEMQHSRSSQLRGILVKEVKRGSQSSSVCNSSLGKDILSKHSSMAFTSNDLGRPSQNRFTFSKQDDKNYSQGYKKTEIVVHNKIDEVPSINSGSSCLPSNKENNKMEIKVQLGPTGQKQAILKKPNNHSKGSMQVSIIHGIQDTKNSIELERKDNKCITSILPKQSVSLINDSDIYSRPWITNKTITRLVSDNQHQISMQNSISESSSEYYSTSSYSGALTQLGRDIAPRQPGGTRTVRVSRQCKF